MKRALVCGAGGFIGSHLVKKPKQQGYWVRGADQKSPEFSPTNAEEFLQVDLRERGACRAALALSSDAFDEVYQLAADMGGMGFIHSAGKRIRIAHVSGPVGVHSRNLSNQRIYSTGWRARFSLRDGIQRTYP